MRYFCRSKRTGIVCLSFVSCIAASAGHSAFIHESGEATAVRSLDQGPTPLAQPENESSSRHPQQKSSWRFSGTSSNKSISSNAQPVSAALGSPLSTSPQNSDPKHEDRLSDGNSQGDIGGQINAHRDQNLVDVPITSDQTNLPSDALVRLAPTTANSADASDEYVFELQTNCVDFYFGVGLLKPTIERLLNECGYTIGRWNLGDAEYEYDFEIVKAYTVRTSGLESLLSSIEATYLIRGTQNTLDQTVDFEPSRGSVLSDMEIEQW